ncbi:MAG: hypothetical protein AB8B86_10775 [Pseudomonadales bacterium]
MTRPTIAAIALAFFCSSAISDDAIPQSPLTQPELLTIKLSEQTEELAEARLRDSSENIEELIQEHAKDKREQLASTAE